MKRSILKVSLRDPIGNEELRRRYHLAHRKSEVVIGRTYGYTKRQQKDNKAGFRMTADENKPQRNSNELDRSCSESRKMYNSVQKWADNNLCFSDFR